MFITKQETNLFIKFGTDIGDIVLGGGGGYFYF